MNKSALRVLSVGLAGAILLGLRTIFFTPGSTVTKESKNQFTTQSLHSSASPEANMYIPFDPKFGRQGTQRSTPRDRRSGKSESLSP